MRAADREKSACVVVRIDVENSFLLKLVCMRFSPLRGTDQGLFLAVPGTEDDRAFWAPAALGQLTHSLSFCKNGNHPADGIFGAIHPRVVMVAPNHPLIGPLAAA